MPITYKFVAPNTEEYEKLQTFAKTFDHVITPHAAINTFAHYRDDICFGYSDHVFAPVSYPAFHPELTRPRDVIQAMSDWRAYTQLSGKAGLIGVPLNNRDGLGNFPESTMIKLGLVRMNREIYAPR